MKSKVCTGCLQDKPLTEFYLRKSKGMLPYPKCRPCHSIERRKSKAKAKDRISIAGKSYYQKNKQKIADYQVQYRSANKSKISERFYRYYEENRDKILSTVKEYRSVNPEKCAEMDRKKRARRRAADGSHTASDVRVILEAQRWRCASCLSKLSGIGEEKFHVDHIMPLSKGGSDDKYNLQCLCPRCNMRKNAKHPHDWAKENGKLI